MVDKTFNGLVMNHKIPKFSTAQVLCHMVDTWLVTVRDEIYK